MACDHYKTGEENKGPFQPKRAFKDKEAGAYIGMSESWLRHSRIEGARLGRIPGPQFIKIGRSVRYLVEDLDEWLEKFQKFNHLTEQFLSNEPSRVLSSSKNED